MPRRLCCPHQLAMALPPFLFHVFLIHEKKTFFSYQRLTRSGGVGQGRAILRAAQRAKRLDGRPKRRVLRHGRPDRPRSISARDVFTALFPSTTQGFLRNRRWRQRQPSSQTRDCSLRRASRILPPTYQSNPGNQVVVEPRTDCPCAEAHTVPVPSDHRTRMRAGVLSSRARVCSMELQDGHRELDGAVRCHL